VGVLATKLITVLELPSYLPDLAPSYFFSVPEDKGNIERKPFNDIDDISSEGHSTKPVPKLF
jgi:hypothetical protein